MTAPFPLEQARVPARYYGLLIHVLDTHGFDVQTILEQAGLVKDDLLLADAQLSIDDLEALVRALVSVGGQSDLALFLGREIRLRDHSLVGFALISSPSIDYGLRLVMRFFRLIFPAFRMKYRLDAGIAEISYTPSMPMSSTCLAFHIETVATATHSVIQELYRNPLPRYELSLSIQEPLHHALYRDFLPQARMQFGVLSHPGAIMRFPAEVALSEPAMANQDTLRLAEQRCRQMLEQIVLKRNTGEWVKMMLREADNGLPPIEELASMLNVSTRTLHRYLKREGFVYRALCVEEREHKARKLLIETNWSVTRIAQELGYSDASNFTRAFRKKMKMSPGHYRTTKQ